MHSSIRPPTRLATNHPETVMLDAALCEVLADVADEDELPVPVLLPLLVPVLLVVVFTPLTYVVPFLE